MAAPGLVLQAAVLGTCSAQQFFVIQSGVCESQSPPMDTINDPGTCRMAALSKAGRMASRTQSDVESTPAYPTGCYYYNKNSSG